MPHAATDGFVEALLAAPVGVATLAAAEASVRDDVAWFDCPPDADRRAVARAADAVGSMELGAFLALALDASDRLAGPWNPRATASLASAYEHGLVRSPIADVIADRFGELLHAPFSPDRQEWWLAGGDVRAPFERKLVDLDPVYGNGEFPWNGLWTVTDPPPETHDGLVDVWELHVELASRWVLPVRPDSRVWTIHRPDDWRRLVEAHPREAQAPHAGWELPGPNQHPATMSALLAQPGQHAARVTTGRHVLPDWTAVRGDHDGVHLSWAGFLTTEGYVDDSSDGFVTMLRYWASERTLWLADVFDDPRPADEPNLSGSMGGTVGISTVDDADRRARDLQALRSRLGRST